MKRQCPHTLKVMIVLLTISITMMAHSTTHAASQFYTPQKKAEVPEWFKIFNRSDSQPVGAQRFTPAKSSSVVYPSAPSAPRSAGIAVAPVASGYRNSLLDRPAISIAAAVPVSAARTSVGSSAGMLIKETSQAVSRGRGSMMAMAGGSALSSTVYEPFNNTAPSEYSGGGYTPDVGGGPRNSGFGPRPDTKPANTSPIGEPWILLAFAALFGGWITRKKKRILTNNMKNNTNNMKTLKHINNTNIESLSNRYRANIEPLSRDNRVHVRRLGLLFTLIFILGVGNMWGAQTYYYSGTGAGKSDWEKTPMTVSTDGYYEYIQISKNTSGHEFKIGTSSNQWAYNYTYVKKGYNNTNVSNIGDYSSNNCYCWHGSTHYILVYYPSTNVNNTTKPIICASTTLPTNGQYYIYYVNQNNWTASNVKAYLWTTLGGTTDEYSGWSGVSMTSIEKKYNGKDIYRISVYRDFANVVFSNNGADVNKTGDLSLSSTNKNKMFTHETNTTTWRTFAFDVTLNKQSGTGGTSSVIAVVGSAMPSATAPTRTGYTFGGYYTSTNGSGTQYYNASMTSVTNCTASTPNTLYAKWTAKQCNITLDYQTDAEGWASSGSISNAGTLKGTYGSAMTTLAGTMPTAKTGFAFMGFYSGVNGTGTRYYNADGTSARTWNVNAESTTTLYAYYQKIELNVTFTASTVSPGATVSVTAVPNAELTTPYVVCWTILHNNGTAFDPQPTKTPITNGISFTAETEPGTYKVHAELKFGSSCETGTLVDEKTEKFVVASSHSVTVRYMCDDVVIKEASTVTGKPLEWTSITAPTIFGYTFSKWKAGDGITIQSADANGERAANPVNFKANYDGVITAKYTKKNIIYFKNTLNWSSVYVYFYGSDGYWNAEKGAGSAGGITPNAMSEIAGTNIWYYEYTGTKERHVAFTKDSQTNYENFYETTASYPSRGGTETNSEFSNRGFNAATPMFVPNTTKKETKNGVDYFSNGYWTSYLGNTGYTLKIYNQRESGRTELYSIPFTAGSDNAMPYYAEVDLEAGKTYGFKFERADGIYYYNSGSYTITNNGQDWDFPFDNSDHNATGLQTNAAGTYRFTLSCNSTNGNLYVSIKYPIKTGDYRLVYKDNATWSLGSAHSEPWNHPSGIIPKRANGVDTISFFITKDKSPQIRWQKATEVSASSVTWGTASPNAGSWISPDDITESGVYNFKVTQDASGNISSVTNIGKYTGNYYIRVDAVTGKWDNYRSDHDHMMSYTDYSSSRETNTFGPLYTHYKAKWCPRNTNIKFCIANDYSPCISDTLITDIDASFNNVDAYGTLKYEESGGNMKYDDGSAYLDKYSANIRFMWNETTNVLRRAYVSASTSNEAKFLVLQGSGVTNKNIYNSSGGNLSENPPGANSILLQDDQDFIYETVIKVNPLALVKLYANYCGVTQYFRGAAGTPFSTANAMQILGGTTSSAKYLMRIVYDFKTNRLICAWMPDGTTISTEVDVEADVMVIRDHQEAAQCITFSGNGKLTDVKTVYGVMRFNRWTLNNRARGKNGIDDQDPEHCKTPELISEYHPVLPTASQTSGYERGTYFISFPFDVKLSEIFGIGTYGKHWILSTYNGRRRAERGYFYDQCWDWDCTNWDYIIEEKGYDPKTFVLEKNKGYLLQLALDEMQYDNTEFWLNNISQKELFFPSTINIETITSMEVTLPALGDEYKCTINRNIPEGKDPESDRRVKDSYWRCIGVPSYAEYGAVLKTGANDITWQTDYTWREDFKNFPFLYEWDVTDNSLTPQSTKNFRFKPMHAYLVQNGNSITWTAVSATPSHIVARHAKQTEKNIEYTWNLMLKTENDSSITFIRMTDDEQVTDTFDFAQDLIKEFRDGILLDENKDYLVDNEGYYVSGIQHSDIYSFIGYERIAGNSLPLNTKTTTIVPIGVRTRDTGDFTFTMPSGTNGVGITLIDKENQTRTNLALGDYTVTLEKGQFDNRFSLEISPVQDMPTEIGNVQGDEVQSTKARKMLIDGVLYIVRDDKIYDCRGVLVH